MLGLGPLGFWLRDWSGAMGNTVTSGPMAQIIIRRGRGQPLSAPFLCADRCRNHEVERRVHASRHRQGLIGAVHIAAVAGAEVRRSLFVKAGRFGRDHALNHPRRPRRWLVTTTWAGSSPQGTCQTNSIRWSLHWNTSSAHPSQPCNRRINAQSSTVITPPSSR